MTKIITISLFIALALAGLAGAADNYTSGVQEGLKLGWMMGELKGASTFNATALAEYNRLVPEYNARMEEIFGPGVVTPLETIQTKAAVPVQQIANTGEIFNSSELVNSGAPIINTSRSGIVHEIDKSFETTTTETDYSSFLGLTPISYTGSAKGAEELLYGNLGGV